MLTKRYVLSSDIFRYLDSLGYEADQIDNRTKTVYTVNEPRMRHTVIKYSGHLKGLVVLESIFERTTDISGSQFLKEIEPFILREVSDDPKYTQEALSVHGKPISYDQKRHFETLRLYEASNLFFWQVPRHIYLEDALRLVIFKNVRLFSFYKRNFIANADVASLHRLRIVSFREHTLLRRFEVLDKKLTRFCAESFLSIYETSETLRYLYFLEELWHNAKTKHISLIQPIEETKGSLQATFKATLLNAQNTELIDLLYRELPRVQKSSHLLVEEAIPQALDQDLQALNTLIAKLHKRFKDDALLSLYRRLIAVETLVEEFYHMFDQRQVRDLVDTLDILVKPLRFHLNCTRRHTILQTLYGPNRSTSSTLCCSSKEREENLYNIKTALKLLAFEKPRYRY